MECHSSQTFDNRQPEKPYDKYLEILCVKTFFVCHDDGERRQKWDFRKITCELRKGCWVDRQLWLIPCQRVVTQVRGGDRELVMLLDYMNIFFCCVYTKDISLFFGYFSYRSKKQQLFRQLEEFSFRFPSAPMSTLLSYSFVFVCCVVCSLRKVVSLLWAAESQQPT